MTAALPQPKPSLMKITPYAQGKSKAQGVGSETAQLIKLSSNESPYSASPKALAAGKAFNQYERYPDGSCAALREAIGKVHGLDPSRLVCGAGSDELINLLIHAYAGEGDEVLYSQHGFLMYAIYAMAHGATPITAPEKNLTADVDALLAAVTANTKIVFLANPNNPTGTYLPAAEVQRLRDGLPPHVLLAVDAAYAEYVLADDYSDGAKLVDSSAGNAVMLRTFSKIYGLSALRLGWAYAPAAVVDVLNRIRSPFNVSSIAQVMGAAAVQDTAFTMQVRDDNAKQRAWLEAELRSLNLPCVPSEGNFLLIHFGSAAKASDVNTALHRAGIIPREVGNYGLPEYLRLTVGTEAENRAVISALNHWRRDAA